MPRSYRSILALNTPQKNPYKDMFMSLLLY
jgi:hypothetical protein